MNLFSRRRMKMLSRPDGFKFYGNLRVDFFSASEWLHPNMKFRLRLLGARPNFYMISDNHNVSPGIVDFSLYTGRIALKDVIKRNQWTCLLTLLWKSSIWKLSKRTSLFLPDKTSSFKKKFSTRLQFVGLLLQ